MYNIYEHNSILQVELKKTLFCTDFNNLLFKCQLRKYS